jgi:hypothetical protein
MAEGDSVNGDFIKAVAEELERLQRELRREEERVKRALLVKTGKLPLEVLKEKS